MQNVGKYKYFGVMLDCSRNAVMKVSQVKFLIDCLQKMGYNTLELYTEDTYEVDGEPYFGYLRGRYTAAEIKEIDAYAKEKGIELIPCIQTLAHFSALIKNGGEYADIIDVNDILLCGEEKTYEFLERIFKTLAENFSSRQVNIGMDEAHMVGLGKYLDKNGYKNRFDILNNHLKRVMEIAEKYGFTAHMWSDMYFRLMQKGEYYSDSEVGFDKEVLDGIPENVELAYWDYYHTDKKVYDAMFESHKKMGRKLWFAGGAWTWVGFAPYAQHSLNTMKPAMESVIKHGIENVLITMWGDNGRECSPFALLPALYAIRQYADGNFDAAKIEKGFYELFKIEFSDFMLSEIPNRASFEESADRNFAKMFLYSDPFLGIYDDFVEQSKRIPYAEYAKTLKRISKGAGVFKYIFECLSKLCDVLAIKTDIGVRTRKAYQADNKIQLTEIFKDYTALEKKLRAFHKAFYTLWHTDNKSQGWEIQDARIGGLIQRVCTCKMRLQLYLSGKIEKIEELEEKVLPYNSRVDYVHLVSRSIV